MTRDDMKKTREQREASLFSSSSSLVLFFWTERRKKRRNARRKPKRMSCRGEAVSGCGLRIGGERSRGWYDEMGCLEKYSTEYKSV